MKDAFDELNPSIRFTPYPMDARWDANFKQWVRDDEASLQLLCLLSQALKVVWNNNAREGILCETGPVKEVP